PAQYFSQIFIPSQTSPKFKGLEPHSPFHENSYLYTFRFFQFSKKMTDCIPYRKTNYFSNLICDYLDRKKQFPLVYHRFPQLENFERQLLEKEKSYPLEHRKTLAGTVEKQYDNFEKS